MVTTDNVSSKQIKAQNLIFVFLYNDIFFPSSYALTITGRVYDSVYGYVDVSPVISFAFVSISQLSVLLTVELDLDGDDAYELKAYLHWTDLSGPIGADLGDDDMDQMHNSWETNYMLDPTDPADAGVDTDSDGLTNLQEYQAGRNPNIPGS